MKLPTPIFIISYNRGAFLRQAVDSYRKLDRITDIVIHDNGSDDRETVDTLSRLERDGCIVIRRSKISRAEELNNTNKTIYEYFNARRCPSNYVVTDCDVDMSISRTDALDVYEEILTLCPSVQCVGPMLRIRDIPKNYPLFAHAMNRHIEQFWHRSPDWIHTRHGPIATIECLIDTTFALHRADAPFSRQKIARRVYHPYEAKHLDWYLDPATYGQPPYFLSSSSDISHWHNKIAHHESETQKLRYEHFIYVDEDENGTPLEKVHYMNRDSE